MFFIELERPLSGQADVQPETLEIGLPNDRFTPESGRWGNIGSNGRN
jgi:hypothetical protein